MFIKPIIVNVIHPNTKEHLFKNNPININNCAEIICEPFNWEEKDESITELYSIVFSSVTNSMWVFNDKDTRDLVFEIISDNKYIGFYKCFKALQDKDPNVFNIKLNDLNKCVIK